MTRTHRIPAGRAQGALGGMYPEPAMGCPPLSGTSQWDDFKRLGSAGDYGESRLEVVAIGSGTCVPSAVAPGSLRECGVVRVTTSQVSSAGSGGGLGMPVSPALFSGGPPPGLDFYAKLRLESLEGIETFTGFWSSYARVAGSTHVLGFEAAPDSRTNWHGVVSDGSTTTRVDLGVAADGDWVILGLRVFPSNESTADIVGVQFYVIDADRPTEYLMERDAQGDLVTTGIPTSGLTLSALSAMAVGMTSDVAADIDFYGWGGPGRR